MRTSTTQAAQLLSPLLFLASTAQALPEVAITKHRHADFNPARLQKRQDSDTGGTVETNTYDVLTWSTGGAYYANGEFIRARILSSGKGYDMNVSVGTSGSCLGTVAA